MIVSAWRYFLYFYGLIFDSKPHCDRNDQLSASRINRTEFPLQYMGSWYFLAAAAESGTGALDIFKVMDNGQFLVRERAETEKLEFRASIRIKDGSCVPRKWIYLLTEDSTELRTEGHPDRLTELFSCRCPECVILKESDNATSRLLLYARSTQLDEDCMNNFLHKSTCEDYREILQLPRSLEKCPQDE
ncbi:apolipoprotein M isoform X2 [Ranitomeya variabilis]|uniref:apolipoprotein M isoform X2 n=1 Tax=Ranitomeya variabilis TaxID=490064 RepID=UPI004056B6D2